MQYLRNLAIFLPKIDLDKLESVSKRGISKGFGVIQVLKIQICLRSLLVFDIFVSHASRIRVTRYTLYIMNLTNFVKQTDAYVMNFT
jgi:hypothetical protein